MFDRALLAFGFVTPAFAGAGLLLVSVPIIIHILNRRRFRTVEWAAMTFLLQALRKNRRRLRFEQWLLLATRCAVVLLLGLALARPMGCEDTSLANLAGHPAGVHVIVIDNSYSMAYEAGRPEAKTHLDQAKLLAKRLIDRLSAGGESVAIITAGSPATAVISPPTYDLQAARSAIDRIQQSYTGTDLPGALNHALELGKAEASQRNRSLYLFTDATRSAWSGNQGNGLNLIGPELAKIYQVTHLNLGRSDQWNHAVLGVDPEGSRLVRLHFDNLFVAKLAGFGNAPQALLQWKLDDQVIPGATTVQPHADPENAVQPKLPIREGGPHVVSVNLSGDDRLKIDDTRWRVVQVASELKVLIVDGERGISAVPSSGAFLQAALAPGRDEATHAPGASYVSPELISDLEFGNKILADYSAVILAGVAQLQPAQADQLQHFVQAGGTLIIFGGDPINSENYNTILLPRQLTPGALTKRITASADQSYKFDFNPNGAVHPLLHIFEHVERSGLDTAQVFNYWQVDLSPQVKAQRVLNYAKDDKGHQDPAITLHALGAGQVVFVATSAGPESGGSVWNTLPVKYAYVTLIHELLSGSVSGGDAWMNLRVGDSLEVPGSVPMTAAPVLRDPAQVEVAMQQAQTSDGRATYRSAVLSRPGLYTLLTGSRQYPVAVNVPPDEADIRVLDSTALRKALGDIQMNTEGDDLSPLAQSQQNGTDFGWSVMVALLCFVGLECFMAMKFGHYRR